MVNNVKINCAVLDDPDANDDTLSAPPMLGALFILARALVEGLKPRKACPIKGSDEEFAAS